MNRYSYEELKAAVKADPCGMNIDALGAWFEQFGNDYWNGEYYDADEFKLFPIYKEVAADEFEIVAYEIR